MLGECYQPHPHRQDLEWLKSGELNLSHPLHHHQNHQNQQEILLGVGWSNSHLVHHHQKLLAQKPSQNLRC